MADDKIFSGRSGIGGGSFTPEEEVKNLTGIETFDLTLEGMDMKLTFTPDSQDSFKTEDTGQCVVLLDGKDHVGTYKRTNFVPVTNPFPGK